MVRMAVASILPHAESGPNDHRKDAPRLEDSQRCLSLYDISYIWLEET